MTTTKVLGLSVAPFATIRACATHCPHVRKLAGITCLNCGCELPLTWPTCASSPAAIRAANTGGMR